jgi:hypothetical protein
VGEIDGLGVDIEHAAGGGFWHRLTAPAVVAEPRMFTFPSSPAGAKDQPRSSQRPEDQPPSGRGSALPPLTRRIEARQPPSRGDRSVKSLSRAHRAARRRCPVCAPRCKFSTSEPLSRILRLVLLINLASVFSQVCRHRRAQPRAHEALGPERAGRAF